MSLLRSPRHPKHLYGSGRQTTTGGTQLCHFYIFGPIVACAFQDEHIAQSFSYVGNCDRSSGEKTCCITIKSPTKSVFWVVFFPTLDVFKHGADLAKCLAPTKQEIILIVVFVSTVRTYLYLYARCEWSKWS